LGFDHTHCAAAAGSDPPRTTKMNKPKQTSQIVEWAQTSQRKQRQQVAGYNRSEPSGTEPKQAEQDERAGAHNFADFLLVGF
jgi:hypothetical protein